MRPSAIQRASVRFDTFKIAHASMIPPTFSTASRTAFGAGLRVFATERVVP